MFHEFQVHAISYNGKNLGNTLIEYVEGMTKIEKLL